MRFGRLAQARAASDGGKPGTCEVLGLTHVCGGDATGQVAVIRMPSENSCRKFLESPSEGLQRHRHWRRRDQPRHLSTQRKGLYQDVALHRGVPQLERVKHQVEKPWRHAITRQRQRHDVVWSDRRSRAWFALPQPNVLPPGF
jgi:hypothetical protein